MSIHPGTRDFEFFSKNCRKCIIHLISILFIVYHYLKCDLSLQIKIFDAVTGVDFLKILKKGTKSEKTTFFLDLDLENLCILTGIFYLFVKILGRNFDRAGSS